MLDQREFVLDPQDVRIDVPTRSAPVKWVMVVNRLLEPGLVANTAGCLAAAVARRAPLLVGPGGPDASGAEHPGLPWTGCTVLGAEDAAEVGRIRERALGKAGLLVVDMPALAQVCRVYAGYLESLAQTAAEDVEYHGVALVGPRNRVDKVVGRLPLLR
ncbi:DUF2000 domain-containing protein [Streptomonospora sp. S1-112]|uniref:DUF2000 domain-containing protein n=1 Tax=Streptomonospora mangrovi TaxID=2883123 RepID=A0A9X3NN32_9ACTN|nr:DUF2000 domain-containing protein [Streptomonospora mangrovi]MDA0565066.1 DUF2000 domain-containing protein [Streptomonospora mangrovi]